MPKWNSSNTEPKQSFTENSKMWTGRPHCPKLEPTTNRVRQMQMDVHKAWRNSWTTTNKPANNRTMNTTKHTKTTRRMTTRGALKQEDGEMLEDKMQSTNTENEAQQGSPEHMEHQWHMENDSNIVLRNNFITRYIVAFKGINKPYFTLTCKWWYKPIMFLGGFSIAGVLLE